MLRSEDIVAYFFDIIRMNDLIRFGLEQKQLIEPSNCSFDST